MPRALTAGGTDYSHQSLSDIRNDITEWISSLDEVMERLNAWQNELIESSYWNPKVISDLKALFAFSGKFYQTGRQELSEILLETEVEVQSHHIQRIRRLAETAYALNLRYGQVWHQEFLDKDYGEPNFQILENMYTEGRGMAADMLDLSNVAERLQDFIGKRKSMDSGSIVIRDSTVGLVNTGNLSNLGSIEVHISTLKAEGSVGFAEAIDKLTKSVIDTTELTSSARDEIIAQLEELSRQATLNNEERAKPVILKALVGYVAATLSAAGGLAEVWSTWGPTIRAYFGI